MALIIPFSASAAESLPIVVWISFDAPNDSEQQQYQAILAQFSGMPVELKQVVVSRRDMTNDRLKNTLDRVVTVQNASLVFWAEINPPICNTYYYLSDSATKTPLRRKLVLESDTPESQEEFVAIAVAGMVRRLQVTQKIRPRPPEPPKEVAPLNQEPTPSLKRKSYKKELQLSYEGMVISPNILVHGIQAAGWLTPWPHFTVGISFTPFFPSQYQTDELKLALYSRNIAVSAAVLLKMKKINIRLGTRWMLDIRSYRTEPNRTALTEHHDDTDAVHSIAPFVSACYYFSERVGIVAEGAALVGLKDTLYKMTVGDEEVLIQRPFHVKLNFVVGLTIRYL